MRIIANPHALSARDRMWAEAERLADEMMAHEEQAETERAAAELKALLADLDAKANEEEAQAVAAEATKRKAIDDRLKIWAEGQEREKREKVEAVERKARAAALAPEDKARLSRERLSRLRDSLGGKLLIDE